MENLPFNYLISLSCKREGDLFIPAWMNAVGLANAGGMCVLYSY